LLLSGVVACSEPPASATTDLVPATWTSSAAPNPAAFPERCAVSAAELDLACALFNWHRARRALALTQEYVQDR
jgi:hypothetical protein